MQESLIDDAERFESMEIDARILRALSKLGYEKPTLVQSKAIPLAMSGKDIIARARTGSGKTCAYCVPILQKLLVNPGNGIKSVILVPTKELAEQVTRQLQTLILYCLKEFRIHNVVTSQLEISWYCCSLFCV